MTSLRRVVERLRSAYGSPGPPVAANPFEIVLYENIAYLVPEEKRAAAFELLRHRIGLTPRAIERASTATLRAVAAAGRRLRRSQSLAHARVGANRH